MKIRIIKIPNQYKYGGDLNARKWKHADGGAINTHGGIWSNGLSFIDNGGTHEENPYEGVQIGVDNQGIPNLVEEGEVIFNDYVFSNRLTADKKLLKNVGLSSSYDNYSFAKIAEELSKESKERPNDPISKRGLNDSMNKLAMAQETIRQEKEMKRLKNRYARGGRLGRLYSGPGDQDQNLGGDANVNPDSENVTNTTDKPHWASWLQFAPAAGALGALIYNWVDKPDYSSVDTITQAAREAGNYDTISYTPLGNYLTYKPLDRNYYLNQLNAQAAATRNAITNTSNPNRNASLLAADYNAQIAQGNLARQAEEYNLEQRKQVEEFNRGTNMYNSQMGVTTSRANQAARQQAMATQLQGIIQAENMRKAIDDARSASIASNYSTLFENLGNIGQTFFNIDMNRKVRDASGQKTPDLIRGNKKETTPSTIEVKYGGKIRRKKGGYSYAKL